MPTAVVCAVAAIAVVGVALGIRPDLPVAMGGLEGVKLAASGLLAICAAAWCYALTRPEAGALGALLPLPGLALFVAPAWFDLSLAAGDVPSMPLRYGIEAFATIVALGLPVLAILLVAMRRSASLHPLAGGLGAGVLAGGIGAFAYGLHCTGDNAVMISFWYPAAIATVAVTGLAVGRRWIAG